MGELKQFAGELTAQGKLRRAAPLGPEATGARIRVRDGKAFVLDGPFAESKEVSAASGSWTSPAATRRSASPAAPSSSASRARTRAAASSRCTTRRTAEVVADSGKGTPYLLAFHMEPGLTDPDGSKMAEMIAYGEGAARAGKFIETAPLAKDPPPARVQARRGKTVVTDGPFAETKDVIGGYSIVRAASRAEAIEIATRYPHAKWGPVEVRELL